MKRTTMTTRLITALSATLLTAGGALAQSEAGADDVFADANASLHRQLDEALTELADLRAEMAEQTVPLTRELSLLEAELSQARLEYQEKLRDAQRRALDLDNLTKTINERKSQVSYLSNLLRDYGREFEARLHVAEWQRYEAQLETLEDSLGNTNLTQKAQFALQADLVMASIDRLEEMLGGASFEGKAVDSNGTFNAGTYVVVGPSAIFRSDTGTAGTVEPQVNSARPTPTEIPFTEDTDRDAATQLATTTAGYLPFDPTLGNAHRIAATEETFLEHVQKGGPVMYPIFGMAGAALLVALYKWIALMTVRKPSQRKIKGLLDAIARHDEADALRRAKKMGGPVGAMLTAGVEHCREPRELIEEVMYETVLSAKLRINRLLPFIAICAAAAPLLGLLGTVTGIINTFKLIRLFGSGDVKTLSGGISEALITTEFGLIVAIPSLLLHAFLSRKAKGVVDQMEKAAIAFVNQIGRTPFAPGQKSSGSLDSIVPSTPPQRPEATRQQVKAILNDLLEPVVTDRVDGQVPAEQPAPL